MMLGVRLGAGLVVVCLFAAPAGAATIVVDDGNDNWGGLNDQVHGQDGKCTLREAVAAWRAATLVNFNAQHPQGEKINDCDPGSGNDVIEFGSNVTQVKIDTAVLGSIYLTYNQYPYDPGANAGSNVKLQMLTMTSQGSGPPYRDLDIVRADPNAASSQSFFVMADDLTSDPDLRKGLKIFMHGLTFRGGRTGGSGAVLRTQTTLSDRGELWIDYCRFFDNRAESDGGAIYLSGGRAQIYMSLFSGNRAGSGAIARDGGALRFGGGYHVLSGNLFVENSATGGGGAVTCGEGGMSHRYSYFESNTAQDVGGIAGGGAIQSKCSLRVEDSVFAKNAAAGAGVGGGAVYVLAQGAPVVFLRTLFDANTASSSSMTPEQCGFAFQARCVGGAIAALDPIVVRESVFRFNRSWGNVGGAIFANHQSPVGPEFQSHIVNSLFHNNKTSLLGGTSFGIVPSGGAIALGSYGSADTSARIIGNTIVKNGGRSQLYAGKFATASLANDIVATDHDDLGLPGLNLHQTSCEGDFTVLLGNAQSEEGSLATDSPMANTVPYAELGESKESWAITTADPTDVLASTPDLGGNAPYPFDYFKFVPKEPAIVDGDPVVCQDVLGSKGIDLRLQPRGTMACTSGAIENTVVLPGEEPPRTR